MTAEKVAEKMIEYYKGDPKRMNHFQKVYAFAHLIGVSEKLKGDELFLLDIAALTHDIGIKESEKKYSSSAGKYQELEGPPVAEKLLENLGFEKVFIEKVCYLIGHHHTYTHIDSKPYQILVEADFIVNIYEDNMDRKSVETVKNKIFKTRTGTKILSEMFLS